jgi:acyl-CoA dehydrogenase
MDRAIATARLLGLKAAWKYDNRLPMSKDASMAKAYASRAAIEMAETAMSVLGVGAIEKNATLEKCLRDAKAFDILEGTGDMQRLMVTAMHRRQAADLGELGASS